MTTDGATSWEAVEAAVAAFEAAHAAGGPADPAAFCPPPGDPAHLAVARELVRADLEFAWAAGRRRRVEEYRAAFPAVFADPASLRAVAFEEFRQRRAAGDPVRAAEFAARLGVDVTGWASGNLPPPTERVPEAALRPAAGWNGTADRFPEPGEAYLGFRLVRELGRGAFARVYLAEQPELAGRWVALKVSAQFAGEAQTLARLQHANIVPVYSVHPAGRFHAVCMPYFGATTLADVLKGLRGQPSLPASGAGLAGTVDQRKDPTVAAGPAPPAAGPDRPPLTANPLDRLRGMAYADAVLWVGAELADGLAHAHDRGVLHRDLKPANVLLADDGRPMLLDFNLAAGGGGPAGGVGGTPFYMAPEQLAALADEPAAVDARSDVYALGLVLYELLTGRPPVAPPGDETADRVAALRAARAAPPPPARRLNPAVTPAADAILGRCLHPDPARRYPSARHLAEDLRSHLAARPLPHAGEPSARERAGKWVRRNPWAKSLPFAAAVLAVVAGLGLAGYLVRTRQYEREAAAATLLAFQRDAGAARPRLLRPNPTAAELADGVARGQELLGRYGRPGEPGWDRSPMVCRLPAADRAALADELGRVALLTAGFAQLGAGRQPDPAARAAGTEVALDLNRSADALLGLSGRLRPLVDVQHTQLLTAAGRGAGGSPPDRTGAAESTVAGLSAVGRYRQALAALRGHEPTAGDKSWYWQTRGLFHAELGEWAAAVAGFSTALALGSADVAEVRLRRGQAHLALKDYPAAAADFDAAAALTPDDPSVYRDRALARLGLGDRPGAVADLDRSEQLDPGHTRVWFMRAEVRARSGDRAAAGRDREEGLKRTPGDEPSWVARGVARLATDPTGAVADFDRALALNPASRQALQNKANAFAERLGKPAEAVAVLDRLVELHPEYVPARAGRAVLHARLGRRDAAHADAAETLRQDQAPFTRYQLAGVYALTSRTHPADKAEALRLLASALQDREGLRHLPADRDLDPVRADPAFGRLVEVAKALAAAGR